MTMRLEIGKTYVQTFENGDRVFFVPLELCKNGSFRGRAWEHWAGSCKPTKPKQQFAYWAPLWTELT